MEIKWTTKPGEEGTLKGFLQLKGVSKRTLAKVKFAGGRLSINGKEARVSHPVQLKDQVVMHLPPEKANPSLPIVDQALEIVFEDPYLLVVNKPAGLYSVPSPADRSDSVASRVKAHQLKSASRNLAVHTVTRLDRETSGLMIFAKHGYIHGLLDKQLKDRAIDRTYVTMVHGRLSQAHGIIDQPIRRSNRSIIEREVGLDGKESITEYWVKEVVGDYSLVEVKLHTGRTHQIRVHFSHIGHPLVGDDLYGGQVGLLARQALHSFKLSFTHPISREPLEFEAQLAADIKKLRDKID